MDKVKCVLAGDSGVGKSSIMYRFINEGYKENCDTTLGASFHSLLLNKYTVDFWDTAGQERYRSLIPMYLRNSNIILLVFDLSYNSSFKSITSWLKDIRCIDCNLILIGNKLDSKREVNREQVEELILKSDRDICYFELSAKTGTDFEELRKKIIDIAKIKNRFKELNIDDKYIDDKYIDDKYIDDKYIDEIKKKKICCNII